MNLFNLALALVKVEKTKININENFVRLSNANFVCYANSLFQCLNSCDEIGNYFRLEDNNFTDSRDLTLRDIFMKMDSNKGLKIDLIEEYRSLQLILKDDSWTKFGFFDPKELLCILLSKGEKEIEMIQPNSLFCTEIRNDKFSSFFILNGINGSDYLFHLNSSPSLSKNFESYIDTLGRIKSFPKVLIISFPKKTVFIDDLKTFYIRNKEYKLRSFIVYEHEIHYYAVVRSQDNFIKIDATKISTFKILGPREEISLGFYEIQ